MGRVIGLTGGIASGKSLVSAYLRELGAQIIDADEIARRVVQPGGPVLREIVAEFGDAVLNADGTLNRKELGRIVFSDPAKLDRLNRIIHPQILAEIKMLLNKHRKSGSERIAVLDAPLLYEVGGEGLVDEVWVVDVDYPTQLKRLMRRDNLSEEDARRRIAAQIPLEEKVRRADRVIDNRSTPEDTRRQVRRLWEELHRRHRVESTSGK
ncbi:dephospho-CoA kinase CoaE [Thermacetogenium phaeum DSM 12270]|uniref:Dephospho-CoA kinase n=1 Tax=Thermacetogenium phaeum (strain ATCC BAA-254 / DSM 26808 / PB) TaxID=1089553 RepID=K4LG62_THEPS|nr:dephospho-CoA kinase [Thermacetogenium phaeum]AFV12006.1 dephospho-CoA kinase CoaE [Thermacetogenium phaeum DSM 12270]